jgi:hypothetical protein
MATLEDSITPPSPFAVSSDGDVPAGQHPAWSRDSCGTLVEPSCSVEVATVDKARMENRPGQDLGLGELNIYRAFKDAVKRSVIFDMIVYFQQKRELREWDKQSTPTPHMFKQKIVIEYANKYSIATLVETGTYLGHMVNATKRRFKQIYSIELEPVLYKRAATKFSRYGHITILQGDSGQGLPKILSHIYSPCLFWLDAHYSGGITAKGNLETPIVLELEHILSHPLAHAHVILIDDARCFVGSNNYPTLQGVKDLVAGLQPSFDFYVKNDIIRIHRRLE